MDVKSSATTATSSWNNFCEGMAGTTVDGGNVIPLWQFSNNQARVYVRRNPDQTPVGAGYSWISAPVATGNSTWHSFDTIWDVTTGDCEYYMDNVLKFKLSVDAAANFSTLKAFYLNRPILNFEFFQLSGAAGGGTTYTTVDTGMYFDNIKVMIPEPGSLLALSVFGIGMFGFMKRRRA
jgi:hypothetical protein